MKNQASSPFSPFLTVFFSLGALLWSTTKVFVWMVFSIATCIYAFVEACKSVALKETLDAEIMYNFMNYPDEVSPNL